MGTQKKGLLRPEKGGGDNRLGEIRGTTFRKKEGKGAGEKNANDLMKKDAALQGWSN